MRPRKARRPKHARHRRSGDGLGRRWFVALLRRPRSADRRGLRERLFRFRQKVWQEPIDHNVFGLLEQFGDAELASLIAPRTLIVEAARGPQVEVRPATAAGRKASVTPSCDACAASSSGPSELMAGLSAAGPIELVASGDGSGPFGSETGAEAFSSAGRRPRNSAPDGGRPKGRAPARCPGPAASGSCTGLDRHTQRLLAESADGAAGVLRSSTSSLEEFQRTAEALSRPSSTTK